MKTKLALFFSMLLIGLSLCVADASAQMTVKTDTSEVAGTVGETTQKTSKNIFQKIKEACKKAIDKAKGFTEQLGGCFAAGQDSVSSSSSGEGETAAQCESGLMKQAKDMGKRIGEVKKYGSQISGSVSDIKKSVDETTAAGNTIYNEASGMGDGVKDQLGSVADGLASEMPDTSKLTGSASVQVTKLTAEVDEISKKMEDRADAIVSELQAKRKAANDNATLINNLGMSVIDNAAIDQMMQSTLEEASALNEQHARYEADPESFLREDATYADLEKQLQSKKEELTRLAGDMKGLAENGVSKVSSLWKDNVASKYDELLKNNFLSENEDEDTKGMSRIQKYRHQTFWTDLAYTIATSVEEKVQINDKLKDADTTRDNATGADYSQTAVNMQIDQRILDAQNLYSFANILIAQLRMETSGVMLRMPLKRSDYNKNPVVFQIDDYIFTKKDADAEQEKKPLLGSIGDAFKKVNAGSQTVGETLNDAGGFIKKIK